MNDMCTDNRFEMIEEFKKKLIESTNIETSPEEMRVIDNILFRFWQMGWLESIDRMPLIKESAKTLIHSVGNSVSAKVLRNAGRFMQDAIDGEAPDFELVQASSEIPDNSDIISRQAAIDEIADYIHNVDKVIGTGHLSEDDCKDAATSVLEDLPSAQPERKKGKWDKERIAFYWHCSECGAAVHGNKYDMFLYHENDKLNFCPNCGADMRGEKDE